MAAIFMMYFNSIKNNDILIIIKTMLFAVIDTLCLTVIHLIQKLCNPKWPPFLASIGKKAVTAFWLIFYIQPTLK